MRLRLPEFARDVTELEERWRRAKLGTCPHCGRPGTLIGHGFLRGYAEGSSEMVVRGRRLFCSNRHRRAGCGRTVAILLDTVVANFVVRTETLLTFLRGVVEGATRRAAWSRAAGSALSLSSGYRLWRRIERAQSQLRAALFRVAPPPSGEGGSPWAQLLAHLEQVVPGRGCGFARFQYGLQTPLLS